MFVVCCVGSGLCDELIPLLEEPYRVCLRVCLVLCDLETSKLRRARPELVFFALQKRKVVTNNVAGLYFQQANRLKIHRCHSGHVRVCQTTTWTVHTLVSVA